MKLRIFPFDELDLSRGINTLFIEDPCVYSTIVMRLLNLSADPEAKEPLALVKDGKALDISKNLIVVSDPLCRDMEGTAICTALRKKIFTSVMNDPKAAFELERLLSQAADYIKDVAYGLPFDVDIADTVEADALIKAMNPRPDISECRSPAERILHTARVISSLGLWACAVFVGARGFLTEAGAGRLFEDLSALPLYTLFIDRALDTPPVKKEVRTVINGYMWDYTQPSAE